MANLNVQKQTAVTAPPNAKEAVKSAAEEVGKQISAAKKMVFGDKGKNALLKAAAAGALIGGGAGLAIGAGAAGALVGAAAGVAISATAKGVSDFVSGNKEGLKNGAKTALATALTTLTLGPVAGLLTGFAFASGAAQKAAEKVNDFMTNNADKMVAKAPGK